jgi:hypothetical protein
METLNTKPLSSRLRERLSEPAMLHLTQRLVAIPSENPPGNRYEECARTLLDELDILGFNDVRREGACVLASVGTGPRTLYFSVCTLGRQPFTCQKLDKHGYFGTVSDQNYEYRKDER